MKKGIQPQSESKEVKKIGIYLPENRLQDVQKYREKMNFSALFWSAFDEEKHRIDSMPKDKAMSKIVERLKESKAKSGTEQAKAGRADGIEWATDFAEYSELMRLKEYDDSYGYFRSGDRETIAFVASGITEGCAKDQSNFEDENDFWWKATGKPMNEITSAFAAAFVEAALEVFEQALKEGL